MSIYKQTRIRRAIIFGFMFSVLLALIWTVVTRYLKPNPPPSFSLRVGLLGEPSSLNIFEAKDLNVHIVLSPIHRGLISLNRFGQFDGALAERWSIDSEAKIVDFYLKEESSVSSVASCSEFLETFELNTKYNRAPLRQFTVRCLKRHVIRFENVNDIEILFSFLSRIYNSVLPSKFLNSNVHSEGFGNFRLYSKGSKEIRLVRKNIELSPREILFEIFDSVESALDAFKVGLLDVLPISDIASIPSDLDSFVHTSPAISSTWFIAMGTGGHLWKSPIERACVNSTLDRRSLASIFNRKQIEFAIPAFSVISGIDAAFDFRPSLIDKVNRACATRRNRVLEMIYAAESSSQSAVRELLTQLEALGYIVVNRPLRKQEFIATLYHGRFDLAFVGYGASDSVKESIFTFYSSLSRMPFVPHTLRLSEEMEKRVLHSDRLRVEELFSLQAELWTESSIIPLFHLRPANLVQRCFELEATSAHNPILNIDTISRDLNCEKSKPQN